MTISNNKTSLLVSSQVPGFVREDHEKFVKFLEAYYKFMEQEGGVLNTSKQFNNYTDIDLADEVFRQKLYNNFLTLIPQDIIVDKNLILKHIKDFYRARGSEKSLRFLLNILLDKIFVPTSQNVYVLRLKTVLLNGVSNTSLTVLNKYNGLVVTGANSYATGTVSDIKRFYDSGSQINELVVVSVDGEFSPGENIIATYTQNGSINILESRLYKGEVEKVIINPNYLGTKYIEGSIVPLFGETGTNANVIISRVTPGNVNSINVTFSGAGFRVGQYLSFASNTGANANAYVSVVNTDQSVHPNSYIILTTTIAEEANTVIGNTKYSNANSSISDPANNSLINVSNKFLYDNVGPIQSVYIANGGSNYVTLPEVDVSSNTRARSLGILGRMDIINGGLGYEVGDYLTFNNVVGGYGMDANAVVTEVSFAGTITKLEFIAVGPERPGGVGWDMNHLPTVTVNSANGAGANIATSCTIGDGEVLTLTNTNIGVIEAFTVLDGGDGYETPPTVDLELLGDGTAIATAIVRDGVYKWPSKYIYGKGEFTADRDPIVYYPKQDILRASDGKWYVEKVLRVENLSVNNIANSLSTTLDIFVDKKIRGVTSNATAIIEKTNKFYEERSIVNELVVSNIKGNFLNGEKIFSLFEENGEEKYISATTFDGALYAVEIKNPGLGYEVGNIIPIEGGGGANGNVIISKVSAGNIKSITVTFGGAGFQEGDTVQLSGAIGTGATANVVLVQDDNTYHPNSYQVMTSTILEEANTLLNSEFYSNLSSEVGNPASQWILNVASFFTYANTGPVLSVYVINPGEGYAPPFNIDIQSNTRVRSLGVLGRLAVEDGGSFYQANDKIIFNNVPGGYGLGAYANVTSVNPNGTITGVKFESLNGEIIGGAGYEQQFLPLAEVQSTFGYGANVIVKAILGDGEVLVGANSSIGAIEELRIVSRGDGYETAPTLNLKSIGNGTAQASISIIDGVFSYPGRYISDDGMVSSSNFLQDKDYYQNYSYVVKSKGFVNNYYDTVKNLVHPAGAKLFAEYLYEDEGEITESQTEFVDSVIVLREEAVGLVDNIYVTSAGSLYNIGDPVRIISAGETGANATAIVSEISSGNVNNLIITFSGAGFQANDLINFTGTDATAKVVAVNKDETYHPNSYNIYTTTINVEANTVIGNTKYSNANSSITDPANVAFWNVMPKTSHSNVGVIQTIIVLNSGNTTNLIPTVDAASNTFVRPLGLMGRLEIVRGGVNYIVGDLLTFTNVVGGHGYGANAAVTAVAANGAITQVRFTDSQGERIGGAGYNQNNLPTAAVTSATGSGAEIRVRATIGDGEILTISNTSLGAIERITVINRGNGYDVPPTIDLTGYGDGTAQAYATIITTIADAENVL